jgi:hypothetical protein
MYVLCTVYGHHIHLSEWQTTIYLMLSDISYRVLLSSAYRTLQDKTFIQKKTMCTLLELPQLAAKDRTGNLSL